MHQKNRKLKFTRKTYNNVYFESRKPEAHDVDDDWKAGEYKKSDCISTNTHSLTCYVCTEKTS